MKFHTVTLTDPMVITTNYWNFRNHSIPMKKKIIQTKEAPAPIGPYNQAVICNGLLFMSGQIAIDPNTGELMLDTVIDETTLVMNNIKAILATAGCGFDDVIKCSIFLSDMNNFNAVNEVYGSYFTSNFPARECVEVSVLPKNVNVEISVIAALPEHDQ